MIRVDEWNLVRTADRLPRNLGSRAIGAEVVAAAFVIDLSDLGGAARLRDMGLPVQTLVAFPGH